MDEQATIMLSGMGYYKLTARRRKILMWVLGGSLLAHAIGLLIFGGYVVMRSKPEKVAIFTTPPPSRTYEPRKLELQVKVQKQQRSSSRPALIPRMVSMKLSDVALPDIKVDPKIIHTTFQPKFRAVSGKGMGAGLGTGYGTHGFGAGVSSVNFFGIQARGDRIAVLVDVSVSMVEEERGGVAGYMRVKQRIEDVIDALAESSMFNLIVFGDAAKTMEKEMVIANNENKKRAKLFLRPFNTEGNWGLTQGNVEAVNKGLRAEGGSTRLDLALTAAFLQGADTILVISDGIPMVKKGFTAEQNQAWSAHLQQWNEANSARVAEYAAAEAAAPVTTERVWIPPTPARPPSKTPPREGQAPDMGSPAREGRWEVVTHRNVGRARPEAPKRPDPGMWTLTDFIEHLTLLHAEVHGKTGREPPVIHCIGYQIDREGKAFLDQLAKHYHGKFRNVSSVR